MSGTEAGQSGEAEKNGRPKILLVDDEPELLQLLARCLSASGSWEISTASHPLDAYRLLLAERFDLVCSDYRMPGITGRDLIDLFRGTSRPNAEVPVLVLSGYAEEARQACEGMVDVHVLEKPVRSDLLEKAFVEALRGGKGRLDSGESRTTASGIQRWGKALEAALSEVHHLDAHLAPHVEAIPSGGLALRNGLFGLTSVSSAETGQLCIGLFASDGALERLAVRSGVGGADLSLASMKAILTEILGLWVTYFVRQGQSPPIRILRGPLIAFQASESRYMALSGHAVERMDMRLGPTQEDGQMILTLART